MCSSISLEEILSIQSIKKLQIFFGLPFYKCHSFCYVDINNGCPLSYICWAGPYSQIITHQLLHNPKAHWGWAHPLELCNSWGRAVFLALPLLGTPPIILDINRSFSSTALNLDFTVLSLLSLLSSHLIVVAVASRLSHGLHQQPLSRRPFSWIFIRKKKNK
jgi:hypothetical protein